MWTSRFTFFKKKILCVCALCMEMCIICVHYALRPKEDAVPQKLELEMVVSHHVKSNQGLWKISQCSSPLSPLSSPLCFPLWCFCMVFIPCTVFSKSVSDLACFDHFHFSFVCACVY